MSGGSLDKKRAPAYVVGTAAGPAEFHYSKPAIRLRQRHVLRQRQTSPASSRASLTAGTCYEVCGSKVKTGLCDKRLLKGGLALTTSGT